jgi:hypothetical protein
MRDSRADPNRRIRRTAFITVALAATLLFGLIVLLGGDWIPGTLIVAASVVGLARQVPVIRDLCRSEDPPPASRHTPAH